MKLDRRSLSSTVLVFISSIGAPTLAAATDIQPGNYVLDDDAGKLTIKKTVRGFGFSLYAENGGPGYSCQLDGVIEDGQVKISGVEPGGRCQVRFTAAGSYVTVSHNRDPSCHELCGTNADFNDLVFAKAAAK